MIRFIRGFLITLMISSPFIAIALLVTAIILNNGADPCQ